jgi:hypothetical protein
VTLKANLKGVTDILNAWKDRITPAPAGADGKLQTKPASQTDAADIDTLISQLG